MENKTPPNWYEVVYYDDTSPSGLRWKLDIWAGKNKKILKAAKDGVAGHLCKHNGYWNIKTNFKSYRVHRIVWELVGGNPLTTEECFIDHINGDRSCNNVANLRIATKSMNHQNQKKRVDNSTGITGVSLAAPVDGRQYYVAKWRDSAGAPQRKYFAVHNLGKDEAFRQAIEWRQQMINDLIVAGQNYTDSHGIRE